MFKPLQILDVSGSLFFIFSACYAASSFCLLAKMDPWVPVVYVGFGALMLTTIISYFSHSQVNLDTAILWFGDVQFNL